MTPFSGGKPMTAFEHQTEMTLAVEGARGPPGFEKTLCPAVNRPEITDRYPLF
jgi:hypothetical protein